MGKLLHIASVLGILVSVVGCASPAGPVAAGMLQSSMERIGAPDVDESNLEELSQANAAFALELYQVLRKDHENLFYSPYSISVALALAYAGARGETEQQMADAMHYTLSQERLHAAFNALDQALASRGEGAMGKDGQAFQLHVANAIWGQQDYSFLDAYLDVLALNYGAGLRLVDFVKAPEEARVTINDWVSEQTEGRIEDLIPAGAIDALTRLVLTNAIYFNAAWAKPFDEKQTEDGSFRLLDGSQVTVPMMKQVESLGYAMGKGYQAVELPYDGNELSMVILVPDEGQFDAFEDALDAGHLEAIVQDLRYVQVALSMPQFKIESSLSLADALAAMGMPAAFSDDADFSGMTGNHDLAISDVVHKAFVSVDESGTEAAAATAVIMKLTAMPAEPLTVTIDRPFIFAIRDIQTGSLLFVGRVVDPSQ
ncbi:MAG: serpin family protein [Anaerolineae bacterium]